jgi:putative ABC transport system permease protein
MLNKLRLRLQALFFKSKMEEELDEEVCFHLEREVEENIARGMSPEEARFAALRSFGGVERVKEESRDERGIRLMEEFWQDLRYGARMLLKNSGFTSIAVLTLALGIGANTAIFSVVHALLLRPVPYHEPDQLALLTNKSSRARRSGISYPNFSDWRERAQSFEEMAAVRGASFNLTGIDKPVQAPGRMVSWNFFRLLGIQPQLGRMFAAEDDRYGAARMAIISHGLWQERFGGEASVIGRKLRLSGELYEVIGVLPPGFEYFSPVDLYTPIELELKPNTGMTDRGTSIGGMNAIARLKPGITLAQANSEMVALAAQVEREHPAINAGRSAQAEPLQDVMTEGVRQTLWALLGAVGFILLIACVNVANLTLVRAAERQKEMALRLALGAGRRRIIKQLLSESLLIALSGGAVGVLLGRWMLDGLLALAPDNIPLLNRAGLSNTVLLFTLGVSVLTSLLCGSLPALHASRSDLQSALKEGGRSSAGARRDLTRKTLLVVEVSLALALLVGAGLLVRSMARALGVELGFNPDRLLTMQLMPPDSDYDAARLRIFFNECLTRVSALPGIESAAITHALPIDGSQWNTLVHAADKPVPQPGEFPNAEFTPVSANYFEAMSIRLLRGRWFNSADTANSPTVAVINETLARRIWPGEDPLGKRLRKGMPEMYSPWLEVVGVVANVKSYGVESATPLQTYVPFAQSPPTNFWLVARTTGEPLQAASSVERAIHSIDKDLPVSSVRSMDQLLGNSLTARRLTLVLMGSFAALALLLSAIGVYGVVSYSVRQRTHEIGVRVALGAQRRDVLRLILAQGARLALLGIAIGLGAAMTLTRLMEALLFETRPIDSITFTVTPALLALVVLFACYLPARRATKVDPLRALRRE